MQAKLIEKVHSLARTPAVLFDRRTAAEPLTHSYMRAQRRDMGGVNAAKENQVMINKQIRILENRLEKVRLHAAEADLLCMCVCVRVCVCGLLRRGLLVRTVE